MKKSFTESVYEIVSNIPAGQIMTYKEVAVRVGNPRAARAVGTVLSKNYNTNIPCHRVIRTDGEMGGYNRGGALKKLKILESEGVII